MCLIITIIFMVLSNIGGGISKLDAIILIILFTLFIFYTIFMGKQGEKFDKIEEIRKKEEGKEISILKNGFYLLLGVIRFKIGWRFYS